MTSSSTMVLKCKAILFDLDGTLIDSIAVVDRAWTKWAIRRGREPAAVLPHIHGRRSIDSLRFLEPDLEDVEAEDAWLRAVESSDTEGILEIPGAFAFIAAIPEGRWSIVTSGTSDVARSRMGAVGIATHAAVFGEDVARGKPHPDPYLMAADKLGFDPADCVVFEDTVAGIHSGRAAGMKVVAVTSGANRPDLEIADAVISDYRTLEILVEPNGLRIQI